MNYCILQGNPVDGLNVWGPFSSSDLANEWAEEHLHNEEWWITDLQMEP